MDIPIDVAIGLALIALAIGILIGAMLRKPKRHPREHLNADYSGLPVIEGLSERYFRHDLSDCPQITVAGRQ